MSVCECARSFNWNGKKKITFVQRRVFPVTSIKIITFDMKNRLIRLDLKISLHVQQLLKCSSHFHSQPNELLSGTEHFLQAEEASVPAV